MFEKLWNWKTPEKRIRYYFKDKDHDNARWFVHGRSLYNYRFKQLLKFELDKMPEKDIDYYLDMEITDFVSRCSDLSELKWNPEFKTDRKFPSNPVYSHKEFVVE